MELDFYKNNKNNKNNKNYKKKYDKYKQKYIKLCNFNKYGGFLLNSKLTNITKDFNLYDIESFNQYVIPIDGIQGEVVDNLRLVTIIGETHNDIHDQSINLNVTTTSQPFITITDYINIILKYKDKNSQTFILLEYNTGTNLLPDTNLNSINIKDIVQSADKNKFMNLLFGIDIRETFAGMSELYYTHDDTLMADILKYIEILNDIIKKIFNSYVNIPERYSINWMNYLMKNYSDINNDKQILDNQKNIIVNFIQQNNLSSNINIKDFDKIFYTKASDHDKYTISNPSHYIEILRRVYMKLTDLYTMTIIVRKDLQIDHLIILIGKYHADNLHNILNSFNKFSSRKLGSVINIKGSLYI
ncbi:MAG: hypothetical protein Terrestrivirus1_6 [Terrestrivirus sp.]|uniref:Uncharacterized protein n=1 Tax=Terrestrivirus sp. TaxID=2487775 RepID=A0A3G4ZJX3_9VIRU|nr:MAG: hypothetical protein Terrestrivirus1_6 [Terrestrivirus sp.]